MRHPVDPADPDGPWMEVTFGPEPPEPDDQIMLASPTLPLVDNPDLLKVMMRVQYEQMIEMSEAIVRAKYLIVSGESGLALNVLKEVCPDA